MTRASLPLLTLLFRQAVLVIVAVMTTLPAFAQSPRPEDARIVTGDIERFFAMALELEAAESERDSAWIVLKSYYLAGTPGLHDFILARIGSEFQLLAKMRSRSAYYAHLPESLEGIEEVEPELRAAFERFEELYPDAVFADVYFVIGRMNSGGTTSADKLLIGAEMYGLDADAPTHELNDWERAVLRDQEILPAIVVHELIHVNQAPMQGPITLLAASIREGSADFLGELLVGRNINEHIHEWANPREAELWGEFREVMHGTDLSAWLYGGADPAVGRPADLGYWMGYRIAKAHYDRAEDKRQAVADILQITDFESFLERSGYAETVSRD
ncbi:MAG: hypothetical protein GWN99_17835 [Gemmatimonadetes bacterium]|uniref:DUF2268 domain-containing protein n=1 Tax=Candidatus Kutchimonas denitrificans TaxID=3056748 RepID=A0AAE5CAY0_9BACT|nr:hypothetical protein [Gemmatimonadota bacterium]NIR75077.1 hypothetical protein [Candidatus Kutchimonas denitrificans]NIS02897.1 hypothetical protein [Gemmatimonadota bacterium]NIT68606.1 hypothetical protein [Gemmatimonadota bacterium]NIU52866.1 hypothetical protein [Gemmatimonadota bacterium]